MCIAGLLDAMCSDLPGNFRIVWQCLENHADRNRRWAISVESIAHEINLSVDTVGRALRELARKDRPGGPIIRGERAGPGRKSTVWHMLRSYENTKETQQAAPIPAETQQTAGIPESHEFAPISAGNTRKLPEETPQIADTLTHPVPIKESTQPRHARVKVKSHPMPVDWEPTEEDRAYAIAHGRNPDLCRDDMREYWSDKGTKRPGWSKTYRRFVLQCQGYGKYPISQQVRQFDLRKVRNGFAASLLRDELEESQREQNPQTTFLLPLRGAA